MVSGSAVPCFLTLKTTNDGFSMIPRRTPHQRSGDQGDDQGPQLMFPERILLIRVVLKRINFEFEHSSEILLLESVFSGNSLNVIRCEMY